MIVRLYLLACLAGMAILVYAAGRLVIPTNIRVLRAAIGALQAGPGFDFWAAIFMLLFIPAIYTTMGWTIVRNYREQRATRPLATDTTVS
jgi:hypothetical protein